MKKYIWVWMACVVVMGLGTYAYLNAEEGHDHTGAHDVSEAHTNTEHAGHGEHGDHHGEEDVVHVDAQEMQAFGIETTVAKTGYLTVPVSLPGEVGVNPDRFAHIVPRVAGLVQHVKKELGDRVVAGEVLAVLSSRELSDLKSAFLAAKERLSLAQVTFGREERLWNDGISSEREYLTAKQLFAEARIAARSAEHKLHALGFSDAYLKQLPELPDVSYTRYEITAPFDGIVVSKHITLGEHVKDDTEIFSIADLNSVWVALTVYQKDLAHIQLGDVVQVVSKEGGRETTGKIAYISPMLDEATRTATARVVLPNLDGQWRPGLFVNGRVNAEKKKAALLVPQTALQNVAGRMCVFVETPEGFKARPVDVGARNETHVEIVSGVQPQDVYVAKGAFTLKSHLEKGAFGDGHNH